MKLNGVTRFRDEICKGVDSAAVARALAAGGYLEHEEGRHTKSVRLPGRGKTRVFAVGASILDETSMLAALVINCGDAGDGGDIDGKLVRSFNMPRGVLVPGGGGVAGGAGDTPLVSGPLLGPPNVPGEGARQGKPEGGHVPGRPGVPASQLKRRTLSSRSRKAVVLLNRFGVRTTGLGVVIFRNYDNAALRDAMRVLGMDSWPLRIIDPDSVPFGVPVMQLISAGWVQLFQKASAARKIEKEMKGDAKGAGKNVSA